MNFFRASVETLTLFRTPEISDATNMHANTIALATANDSENFAKYADTNKPSTLTTNNDVRTGPLVTIITSFNDYQSTEV